MQDSNKEPKKSVIVHKRVIILGAGQIGTHIMQRILADGLSVVLIDSNDSALKEAQNLGDIAAVNADGTDPAIYQKIKLTEEDVFIAVTNSDETNLVSCWVARSFGVTSTIARVRRPYYQPNISGTAIGPAAWEQLGVKVLFNQSELATREIEMLLRNPGAIDTTAVHAGQLRINTYRVKEKSLFCGRRLVGLRDIPAFENLIVAAVSHDPEHKTGRYKGKRAIAIKDRSSSLKTIIPNGDYKIQEGDVLHIVATEDSFGGIGELTDPGAQTEFRKIFILGGTIFSRYLADRLQKSFPRKAVYLIEKSRFDAYSAMEKINSKVRMMHVDMRNMNDLKHEGLGSEAVFIGASDSEDDNLLSCLLAKEEAHARTIALVQNTSYMKLIPYMDIDAAVSPKLLLVDEVFRQLKGSKYEVVSSRDSNAEVLELVVHRNSIIAHQTLSEFRFPENSIIIGIFRHDEMIIPRGGTSLEPQDHVVIYALRSSISELQSIFRER